MKKPTELEQRKEEFIKWGCAITWCLNTWLQL